MKAIIITRDGQVTVIRNVDYFNVEDDNKLRVWTTSEPGCQFKIDFDRVDSFQFIRDTL